ncbi:hypothetical protein HNR26_000437 [Rhizobium rosettiformans]|uniref:Uncharacterized protein n=1 Tax=Rhizobium rosettiformans TaxID=1368430 RepID=A0A7W8HLN5_9HYPH|nr:hypothetical protein [Rhizobium rosettiformans]MBB5274399.1 hypothetical protein [Rhizobium rosettiformans]
MPVTAIDEPGQAGHTGQAGTIALFQIGNFIGADRQEDRLAHGCRPIDQILQPAALVVFRARQDAGLGRIEPAAQLRHGQRLGLRHGPAPGQARRREQPAKADHDLASRRHGLSVPCGIVMSGTLEEAGRGGNNRLKTMLTARLNDFAFGLSISCQGFEPDQGKSCRSSYGEARKT